MELASYLLPANIRRWKHLSAMLDNLFNSELTGQHAILASISKQLLFLLTFKSFFCLFSYE